MAKFFILTFLIIIFSCVFADDRQDYIVYMGALPKNNYSPLSHHQSILQEVLENCLPAESLIHNYKRSFNGFAAKLTHRELQKLASMEGIVSIFPSKTIELHTTRSWDFMGLNKDTKRVPEFESDVIVGVIDSGIWPEAESFNDKGFGNPPNKWKGICEGGKNFTCNNKLIGARIYSPPKDGDSARDTLGHGTHTASTVAGNQVKNASFNGLALGKARGAVPSARISAYKVCWKGEFYTTCNEVDVLASFDDAISDGVDIISVSLGSTSVKDFFQDSLAIGAFHAMQKGILTCISAGNNGPARGTVVNVAPWTLTVAASTTDRQIVDKVILADETTFVGRGINPFDIKGKKFPLIDGGFAPYISHENSISRLSVKQDLNISEIKGKIVLYKGFSQGQPGLDGKAAGMILADEAHNAFSISFPLPTSILSIHDGDVIRSYINSTKNPMASILKSETAKDFSAPIVAPFSSRGPNLLTNEILKPDITAPGIDILAAWPVEDSKEDKNYRNFRFSSGTSMSCPHATGAAAYIKSFHPDWSPSMIKSALMTSAFPMNSTTNPDAEFAYGAGHIDPVKAVNPGLVYETLEADYLKILCSMGYTSNQIKLITSDNSGCPKNYSGSPKDVNYPSMISNIANVSFTRVVTNVGIANSTYTTIISSPPNLRINVIPKVLSFKSLHEKHSFIVRVSGVLSKNKPINSASLVWSDGVHFVRSPIVVYNDK